jgi:hypothetical protein
VATLVAIALWGIASLSDTYETTLNVPLALELPPGLALLQEAPRYIEVTMRASGWSLMKMLATGRTEIRIRPGTRSGPGQQIVRLSGRDLLTNFHTSVPDAEQIRVNPDSLTLVLGHVMSKRVPLFPEITINTRDGFLVIGSLKLSPDSVTLTGAADVLEEISVWPTEMVVLNDIHRPIRIQIAVSDTLRGVVAAQEQVAELRADVQEIAERSFSDIPIVNRGTIRDTSLSLILQPATLNVLIRGGAQNLSRLEPSNISAYVDVQEGIDTIGITRPRLILPPGFSVVNITPGQVRYAYRRAMP